jgi:hypothetical protein
MHALTRAKPRSGRNAVLPRMPSMGAAADDSEPCTCGRCTASRALSKRWRPSVIRHGRVTLPATRRLAVLMPR